MSEEYVENNDSTDTESNEDSDLISQKQYDKLNTLTKAIYGAISIGKQEGINIINSIIKKCGENELISYKFKYWTSPLCYAIFLREEEMAMYLIDLGFDVNHIDSLGHSAINYVVGNFEYKNIPKTEKRVNKEMYEVLKKLILKGANIFNKNKSTNLYPVYEALINSYINSYELIKKKIDLIKKNIEKCPQFKDDIKEYIDFHSSQDNDLINRFYVLLDLITENKEDESIEYFNKNKDIVNCIENHGQNALFYAISRNMKSLVKKLIMNDIDYERCNVRNSNILDVARTLDSGSDEMIFYILKTIDNKVKKNKIDSCSGPESQSDSKTHSQSDSQSDSQTDSQSDEKIYDIELYHKKQQKILEDQLLKEDKIKEQNLKKRQKKKEREQRKKEEIALNKQKKIEEQRIKDELIEKEKLEKIRLKQIKLENERLEKEKLENERLENERIQFEKQKQERMKRLNEKKRLKTLKKISELKNDPLNNFILDCEKEPSFWSESIDLCE